MNPKDEFNMFWRRKLKSKAPGVVMIVLGSIAAFCFFVATVDAEASELLGFLAVVSLCVVLGGIGQVANAKAHNNCVMREFNMAMKNKAVEDEYYSEADELEKFKNLLDRGIITWEEFEAKKRQIFNKR